MTKEQEYQLLVQYLLAAYRDARRHKAGTNNCIRFGMNREEEICELAQVILERRYAPRPSICFLVTSPVMREVVAADFRDRIVHHLIFNFLNPYMERLLIYDCYSCRKGKGTDFGVNRLEHHIRSCSRNYTRKCWVLQLDISGYFMSIDRAKLHHMACELMVFIGSKRNRYDRPLRDTLLYQWVYYLMELVIYHDPLQGCDYRDPERLFEQLPHSKSLRYSPPGFGLPIGNLTSQLFSNLYMNRFDHFVKRQLKVKHYGRYVDDSYYVDTNPKRLLSYVPLANEFLRRELGINLNLGKTKLTEASCGVAFLGVYLKPHRRYLKHQTLRRMRLKVDYMKGVPKRRLLDHAMRDQLLASANSYLGVLGHTASFQIAQTLFDSYPMFHFADATRWMTKFVESDYKVSMLTD